jgi:hypothetical protein
METENIKIIIFDGKKRTVEETFECLNSQEAVKKFMKDLAIK